MMARGVLPLLGQVVEMIGMITTKSLEKPVVSMLMIVLPVFLLANPLGGSMLVPLPMILRFVIVLVALVNVLVLALLVIILPLRKLVVKTHHHLGILLLLAFFSAANIVAANESIPLHLTVLL